LVKPANLVTESDQVWEKAQRADFHELETGWGRKQELETVSDHNSMTSLANVKNQSCESSKPFVSFPLSKPVQCPIDPILALAP
jgi:hypothetical protein